MIEPLGADDVRESFVGHIREHVAEYGDHRSYIFVDHAKGRHHEHALTYIQLDRAARTVAAWLSEDGMRGRAALLLFPPGLDFLASFLGCLYAQVIAVPAPLPLADPRALTRAMAIVKDAEIRIILTTSAHQRELDDWLRRTGLDRDVRCVATDVGKLADPDSWTMPSLTRDTIAYLQYTSGSTTDPKGVALSHANLLHNQATISDTLAESVDGSNFGVGWLPHYHDMGLVGQLLTPIYSGCNLVFTSPISFVKRPALWLEMISDHRGTWTVSPNFGYEWCLRQVTDGQLEGLNLSSLMTALNGAEPIRTSTLRKFERRFGSIGFRPRMWSPCYGMAEATLLVAGAPPGVGAVIRRFSPEHLERHRAVPTADGTGVELVASGRPVNVDARIVDPDSLAELSEGQVGEVWIAGGSVTAGYWRRADMTAETYGAHTSEGDGPFLRTGDLGFALNGYLYITGRLKEIIIVNGRNLYPQDLEEIARVHPAAGVGAAFSVDTGEEHVILVQEIKQENLHDLTVEELGARIMDVLAESVAIRSVNLLLVDRGTVVRTTSGKIQRRLMRELFLAGKITSSYAELEPEIAEFLTRSTT